MPKSKKIRSAAINAEKVRHEPLGQVIRDDEHKKRYVDRDVRYKKNHHYIKQKFDTDDLNPDKLLDEKTSQKIIQLSKQQQLEMEAEEDNDNKNSKQDQQQKKNNKSIDSDDEQEEEGDDNYDEYDDDDELVIENNDDGYVTMVDGAAMGLSKEDEELVASMMGGESSEKRKTLADIILEKIEEKEAIERGEVNMQQTDNDNDPIMQLPAKVVQVYTEIGKILSRYTSGKLPKAFKVIPSLSNWEEILYITRPDLWTPQAMYAATRIFASNLNPKMATKFYNLVLLDAVRNDIQYNKKLNYHYYMALRKSVYKPAAFFKGILLPLCNNDNNCTLREAAIIASVLQRVSIPVHHSAVAIHKLAQIKHYSGATSIFIKTLLNKKYSLPVPVISSLVQHFTSFINNNDNITVLPVLWHQALLVFVQRYKNEIQDQREVFKLLLKKHYHYKITPEIRRELFGIQAYKEERQQQQQTDCMEL